MWGFYGEIIVINGGKLVFFVEVNVWVFEYLGFLVFVVFEVFGCGLYWSLKFEILIFLFLVIGSKLRIYGSRWD